MSLPPNLRARGERSGRYPRAFLLHDLNGTLAGDSTGAWVQAPDHLGQTLVGLLGDAQGCIRPV